MSLRTRLLIVALPCLLLPLLAYLLVDSVLMRRALVREQAEQLRLAAEVVGLAAGDSDSPGGAATAEGDPAGDLARVQRQLRRLGELRPDLEIMLIDGQSAVRAATLSEWVGRPWHEPAIGQVLAGETSFAWAIMEHHGEPVLDVSIPWTLADGRRHGVIHLARSLTAVDAEVARVRRRHAAFVALTVFLVAALLSFFVYRFVLLRLSRVERRVLKLAGEQGRGVAPGDGDEIDHLQRMLQGLVSDLASTAAERSAALEEKSGLLARVEGFNEELGEEVARVRTKLLRTQKDLLRAERLSTIGHLAAGLAHELRNPLFIIRASAEAHARKHQEGEALAADIVEEVDRVNALVTRLLDLARPMPTQHRPVDLGQVLRRAAAKVERALDPQPEVRVRCSGMWEGTLQGDDAFLVQAFINLISNACQAVQRTGHSGAVEVTWQGQGAGGEVVVRDDGCGIPAEDLEHVFEPFFTRRSGGTGLGLCIAKKVLEPHGAELTVRSVPGEGTEVRVVFAAP